jgi:tetratricopeptide (TPR) repeat protein
VKPADRKRRLEPRRSRGSGVFRPGVILPALVLVAAIFLVYAPVSDHQFLHFDDADYVTENGAVRAGLTWAGLRWALTTPYAGNWHPLTWLSHMLDVELFGLDAGPHHLMSVFLHAVASAALLMLLVRLTAGVAPSFLVAALFALHPLRVESVAWVAERKDVLSGLWTIVAITAYVSYLSRRGPWRFAWLLAAVALALMSKPMAVTLPFMLVLVDLWPLGRWKASDGARGLIALIVEKWPMWIMAIAAALMTVYSQRLAGAVQSLDAFPIALRMANIPVAYVHYLVDTFWPAGLAVLYPYPESIPLWQSAGSAALLVAMTWHAVRVWHKRPFVLVGWLWFLGTLLPVIGLLQAGSQPFADRFTYIPGIGILFALIWALRDLVRQRPALRTSAAAAAVVALAGLAIVTARIVPHWRNSVTLWERAVDVTHQNYRASTNLGFALAEAGERTRALGAYQDALRLDPEYPNAHNYLGVLHAQMGDHSRAIASFEAAIALRPRFAEARNNLGLSLAAEKRIDEAIAAFEEAVRVAPEFPQARNNLAIAYMQRGRTTDAVREFDESARLQPGSADTRMNLATSLVAAGRIGEALPQFAEAARLGGDPSRVHHAWGAALLEQGDTAGAVEQLTRALQANPRNPPALHDLGRALAAAGKLRESIDALQLAAQIAPGNPDYLHDLGAALARAGLVREAIAAMEAALAIDPNHPDALAALRTLRAKTPSG